MHKSYERAKCLITRRIPCSRESGSINYQVLNATLCLLSPRLRDTKIIASNITPLIEGRTKSGVMSIWCEISLSSSPSRMASSVE